MALRLALIITHPHGPGRVCMRMLCALKFDFELAAAHAAGLRIVCPQADIMRACAAHSIRGIWTRMHHMQHVCSARPTYTHTRIWAAWGAGARAEALRITAGSVRPSPGLLRMRRTRNGDRWTGTKPDRECQAYCGMRMDTRFHGRLGSHEFHVH